MFITAKIVSIFISLSAVHICDFHIFRVISFMFVVVVVLLFLSFSRGFKAQRRTGKSTKSSQETQNQLKSSQDNNVLDSGWRVLDWLHAGPDYFNELGQNINLTQSLFLFCFVLFCFVLFYYYFYRDLPLPRRSSFM